MFLPDLAGILLVPKVALVDGLVVGSQSTPGLFSQFCHLAFGAVNSAMKHVNGNMSLLSLEIQISRSVEHCTFTTFVQGNTNHDLCLSSVKLLKGKTVGKCSCHAGKQIDGIGWWMPQILIL